METESYGRLIPKPSTKMGCSLKNESKALIERHKKSEMSNENNAEFVEKQIELIRKKISLKEKHKKVLNDELEDENATTNQQINILLEQTKELRGNLMVALKSEVDAVHTALRTQRKFQLAMQEKVPEYAQNWLFDKISDQINRLNELLNRLEEKREKFRDLGFQVSLMHDNINHFIPEIYSCEIEACRKLEIKIEEAKVNLGSAQVLLMKYKDIREILETEKDKFDPTLDHWKCQLIQLEKELKNLEKIKNDAFFFRDHIKKELGLTEKNFIIKSNERRENLKQIKGKVKEVLEKSKQERQRINENNKAAMDASEESDSISQLAKILENKKEQIKRFEEISQKFVNALKLQNFSNVPECLLQINLLSDTLMVEMKDKENQLNKLSKEKAALLYLLYYKRYNGANEMAKFEKDEHNLKEDLNKFKAEKSKAEEGNKDNERIQIHSKIFLFNIKSMLNKHFKRRNSSSTMSLLIDDTDIIQDMKSAEKKVNKLITEVKELQNLFENKTPHRDYEEFYMEDDQQQEEGEEEKSNVDLSFTSEDPDPTSNEEIYANDLVVEGSNLLDGKEFKDKSQRFLETRRLRMRKT